MGLDTKSGTNAAGAADEKATGGYQGEQPAQTKGDGDDRARRRVVG